MSGLAPLQSHALGYDKPLCTSLHGFTLHAARAKPPRGTRAGALDPFGREALLRYVLRPPARSLAIARYLAGVGETIEVPRRSPDRGPPHWKSRVRANRAELD